MYKLLKGEYECPQCKKLTVIGRSKKAEEPLTCCDVEMVAKEQAQFTEHPEPKTSSKTKKSAATSATKVSKEDKTKKAAKRKKKIVIEATLPLTPGTYLCQACGRKQDLLASDPRDQWLRCGDCYVKMVAIR